MERYSANFSQASDLIANGEVWPCACHTLQLCVRDAFAENDEHGTLLKKVHDIVVTVRNNPELRNKLRGVQIAGEFRELELVQDNATRWHSQLRMMERFVIVADACRDALGGDLCLSEDEVASLESYVRVLKKVKVVSDVLEQEKVVTLSLVIPSIDKLRRALAPRAAADGENPVEQSGDVLKRSLLEKVNERFGWLFSEVSLPAVASAVDPRTGHLPLFTSELRDAVWSRVKDYATDMLSASSPARGRVSVSDQTLSNLLGDVRSTFESVEQRAALKDVDPLVWWSQQDHLRVLWPVIKMLLSIPASNASAERLFSAGGFLSDGRHSLGLERLEQMCILRHYILGISNDAERDALIARIVVSSKLEEDA